VQVLGSSPACLDSNLSLLFFVAEGAADASDLAILDFRGAGFYRLS
jgi:hypothetical protein